MKNDLTVQSPNKKSVSIAPTHLHSSHDNLKVALCNFNEVWFMQGQINFFFIYWHVEKENITEDKTVIFKTYHKEGEKKKITTGKMKFHPRYKFPLWLNYTYEPSRKKMKGKRFNIM